MTLAYSHRRRCLPRFHTRLSLAVLALSISINLQSAAAMAQTGSTRRAERVETVSGLVLDASGKPAAGAQVSAEPSDGSKTIRVETDTSGKFVMPALEPGSYTIHAAGRGNESGRSTLVVAKGSQQELRIVLNPASSAPAVDSMDFVDKPTVTVAGVTDWTAVGGHGSDATLRTSEELNRQALALRAPQPLAARIGGGKADDEYNLALQLNGSGDFAGAQVHIKQALAERDSADFHRLAAEVEEKLGNPLAAVQQNERAAQLDPSEANYFAWGTELLLHRAIWQAADVFAKGAKLYPSSVRIKTAWGAALFAGANYDEAADKICEASDLDPSAREPYVFAGQIAIASPSTSSCVGQKLERFLTLRPNDVDANYFSAMFLLKQATGIAQDRPRQLFLRAVALDPKCSDGFLQLGILSAATKDYKSAIGYYMKALVVDPQKGEAHYRLAIAYDRTGEPDKAKLEYQLHEQIDAANAALVEQQRREVKQFSVVTNAPPAHPTAP